MINTYKLHSHDKLSKYMKKFAGIEKSLLFEIDGDRIIAKTHTPDKSVVKVGSILLSDVMDPESTVEDVRIGLFSVDNFISSFKNFGESEVKLSIDSSEIDNLNVATKLKAFSKNLKISFPCASTSMFRYIDETLAGKIMGTEDALFSFRIDKETMSQITSLAALDSDSETITIKSKDGNIYFSGKSFELNIPGTTTEIENEISFYKSHYSFVDKEDSEIYVSDNKVIIKSLETATNIVIGKVE